MKITFIILTLIASISSQAQSLKLGDNLETECKKIETPDYSSAPSFSNWIEANNMIMISSSPNFEETDFVFIALSDTTVIGAFATKPPYHFLLDTEGNAILNGESSVFFLPSWTVKKHTKINSADKKILTLLDAVYQKTLQADDLELDQQTMNEYLSYHTDTTLSNRHIALMFDNYQTIINEAVAKQESPPAEISIPLMTSLSQECLSLFNYVPVIVAIYMGEAYQDAGMTEEAKGQFKSALLAYPSSIPLLVYKYQYEEDDKKKAKQLSDLKKKHPNHWLVKQL